MTGTTFWLLEIPFWAFAAVSGLSCFLGMRWAARFEEVRIGQGSSLLVAVMLTALTVFLVRTPVQPFYAVWSVVLITGLACLAGLDARTRTVPDLVSIPMIGLGLAHAAFQDGLVLVFAGSAACVIALGLLIGRLLAHGPGWMGSGDVLLLAGAVAWLGPAMLPDLLLLVAPLLILQRFVQSLSGRRQNSDLGLGRPELPLAPALGLAQIVIWLGGPIF